MALAARRLETTGPLAADLGGQAYACDATLDAEVRRLFADVEADLGTPSLTVYNAGSYAPGTMLETDVASFERAWRVGCLGGFLVGREAGRRMREAGRGTLTSPGPPRRSGGAPLRQPGHGQVRAPGPGPEPRPGDAPRRGPGPA